MDTFMALHRLTADMFDIPPEPLSRAQTLLEVGIDSLKSVDLVLAIEKHFAISIAAEDLGDVRSLQELAAVVDRLITRKAHHD